MFEVSLKTDNVRITTDGASDMPKVNIYFNATQRQVLLINTVLFKKKRKKMQIFQSCSDDSDPEAYSSCDDVELRIKKNCRRIFRSKLTRSD